VEFSPELRASVLAGEITVSFRLWKQPRVKVGGRYAVGTEDIVIDSIDLVPFSSVTALDVRRSGERDRETLRRRAAHSGPIDDDTMLFRVAFHVARGSP
jgi:ASCH domain